MSCSAWPLVYSFHLVYMHFPALVVSASEVSGSDGRKKGGGGPNHTAELCAFCLGLGGASVATWKNITFISTELLFCIQLWCWCWHLSIGYEIPSFSCKNCFPPRWFENKMYFNVTEQGWQNCVLCAACWGQRDIGGSGFETASLCSETHVPCNVSKKTRSLIGRGPGREENRALWLAESQRVLDSCASPRCLPHWAAVALSSVHSFCDSDSSSS